MGRYCPVASSWYCAIDTKSSAVMRLHTGGKGGRKEGTCEERPRSRRACGHGMHASVLLSMLAAPQGRRRSPLGHGVVRVGIEHDDGKGKQVGAVGGGKGTRVVAAVGLGKLLDDAVDLLGLAGQPAGWGARRRRRTNRSGCVCVRAKGGTADTEAGRGWLAEPKAKRHASGRASGGNAGAASAAAPARPPLLLLLGGGCCACCGWASARLNPASSERSAASSGRPAYRSASMYACITCRQYMEGQAVQVRRYTELPMWCFSGGTSRAGGFLVSSPRPRSRRGDPAAPPALPRPAARRALEERPPPPQRCRRRPRRSRSERAGLKGVRVPGEARGGEVWPEGRACAR